MIEGEQRAELVYDAEKLSGVYALNPLGHPAEAQTLASWIVRQPWWTKEVSGVNKVEVAYIPVWDRTSCMHDRITRARMEITIPGLSQGLVYHEMGHCGRGDVDNSHDRPFLKAHFAILRHMDWGVLLPRYARALLDRDLVTGREKWIGPYLTG